ncbi:TPA: hypothetical protein N3A33_005083 [Salmonella enterica subsp. salamae serovar 28:r:e,n,z15]|nr:hypothetical protein [Salmonella enterica subsp. salamae serovar 28:r:e,n,z15]
MRLIWRKRHGEWGSRAELDEAAHRYSQRLTEGITENGIFIGGDEQNFCRLHHYAEKHYALAMC